MSIESLDYDGFVPELEELASANKSRYNRPWLESEDRVLERYYNRVDVNLIAKYLPGRTRAAIMIRAGKLGLTD